MLWMDALVPTVPARRVQHLQSRLGCHHWPGNGTYKMSKASSCHNLLNPLFMLPTEVNAPTLLTNLMLQTGQGIAYCMKALLNSA